MRTFALTLLLVLASMSPSLALDCTATPNMATCDCSSLGTTLMNNDKTEIVACMLITGNTAATVCPVGGCKWKSMTSSTKPSFSCPANQVVVGTDANGTPQCANPTPYVSVASCPSGQVIVGVSGGTALCASPMSGVSVVCGGDPSNPKVMYGISAGTALCKTLTSSGHGTGHRITGTASAP